jgi:hypothetical protein
MGYKTHKPKQLTTRRGTTPTGIRTLPIKRAAQRRAASKSIKATGKNW